jgi:hypothetical protein
MSTDAMPARYRLDSVRRTVSDNTSNTGKASLPTAATHGWLDCPVGATLGVAPKSPTAVTIGPEVPRIIAEVHVDDEAASTSGRGKTRLYGPTLGYLGAAAGDELVVERNGADGPIVVRRAEVDG